jgi:hypothetical protein
VIAETCWSCICGLHEECFDLQPIEETESYQCCCFDGSHGKDSEDWVREVGRPVAQPDEITDVLSTGRKRAAMLYPIFEGMVCEWAGLRSAGGGVAPIIGCNFNKITPEKGGKGAYKQGDVHHGPDKNTLANEPGNAHRICAFCHHRWHAANDKFYGKRPMREDGKVDGTKPFLPLSEHEWSAHDSETLATEEELEENEKYWSTKNK